MYRAFVPFGCLLATSCSWLFSKDASPSSDAGTLADAALDAGMQVELIPGNADFQSVVVGTASAKAFFTAVALENTAPLATSISNEETLAVVDGCAGEALLRGEFCVYEMTFSPSASAGFGGLLEIGEATAPWSGRGLLAGDAVAEPTSLDFGESIVQSGSITRDVVVTNAGEALLIPLFGIVGDGASSFSFDARNCGDIAAGESTCTVSVTYSTAALGAHVASLEIDVDGEKSFAVSLVGATRRPRLTMEILGDGTVYVGNNLSCSSTDSPCSWLMEFGEQATLMAVKAPLQAWSPNCMPIEPGPDGAQCVILMDQDHIVTASF